MERWQQLLLEARAYLKGARQHVRRAEGNGSPGQALEDIARARDYLHEAAARLAERKRLDDAQERDDIPF